MIKVTEIEIRIEGNTIPTDERGVGLVITEAGCGGRKVTVEDNHIVLPSQGQSSK
jgi:hypothetical protein